jgi:hypothetical protein
MTGYYNEGFNPKNVLKKAPPKELEVTYDPETGRFNTNYKVEYSNYLSLIYGYKSPKEYRDTWDSRVSSWNRVFKRIVTGENITAKNKDIILDAKQVFPNFEELAEQAKANGIYAGVEEDITEA